MGDSVTISAIRTGAEKSLFGGEPQKASLDGRKITVYQCFRKNIFTRIYQIITDTLKTWIYASKKTSRQAKMPELYTFRQSSYVGSGAVIKLAEAINRGSAMKVEANATLRLCSVLYPEKDGDKLLAVPLILDGGWLGLAPNHIVTFVYDPKAATLEYYDSKGLTIEERGDIKTIQGKPLKEIRDEMLEKYGNPKLIQNTKRDQQDIHNCGVYVSDYIHRRSEGMSFDAIQKSPLTFAEANGPRRQELITYVEKTLLPAAKPTDDMISEIDAWD